MNYLFDRMRYCDDLDDTGEEASVETFDIVSASITTDGRFLRLTFSRPVTLVDLISSVVLTGNYRTLIGVYFDNSESSAVWDVSFDTTIYSDETFTLNIGLLTFQDSSGNYLPDINNAPVTPGSTVLYLPDALTTPRVAEMRSAGRLYVNRLGTGTTATTDGAIVGSFRCDQGVLWTAPSDAARMILSDMGGGKWALYSDGVDDGYSQATVNATGDSTIIYTASIADSSLRVITSNNVNGLMCHRRSGLSAFPGGVVVRTTVFGSADTPNTVLINRAAAGNWRLRLDASDTDLATSSAGADFGEIYIAVAGAYPEPFSGELYGVGVLAFNAATPTDRDRIAAIYTELA